MVMNYDDNKEVTYEIVEEIGIISSQPTGWTKELNVVSWNGGQGKYDIREWSPMHDRMSRGVTLNEQEMRAILEMLRRRERSVPRRNGGQRGQQEALRLDAASEYAGPDDADDPAEEAYYSAPPEMPDTEPAGEAGQMAS